MAWNELSAPCFLSLKNGLNWSYTPSQSAILCEMKARKSYFFDGFIIKMMDRF